MEVIPNIQLLVVVVAVVVVEKVLLKELVQLLLVAVEKEPDLHKLDSMEQEVVVEVAVQVVEKPHQIAKILRMILSLYLPDLVQVLVLVQELKPTIIQDGTVELEQLSVEVVVVVAVVVKMVSLVSVVD